MPPKEHDRPDPNLIIHGSRRVQPSKRGLGIDYPMTPLEELNERQQSKLTVLSSIIMHLPFQANDDVVMQDIQNDASNDAFFKVYSEVMQGEGSRTRVAKDQTKPDGDACRADGTLKDASEMQWPNSPSDSTREQREGSPANLKRRLPIDDAESDDEKRPKAKVTHQYLI